MVDGYIELCLLISESLTENSKSIIVSQFTYDTLIGYSENTCEETMLYGIPLYISKDVDFKDYFKVLDVDLSKIKIV